MAMPSSLEGSSTLSAELDSLGLLMCFDCPFLVRFLVPLPSRFALEPCDNDRCAMPVLLTVTRACHA